MRIVYDISDLSPTRGKSRGIYSYARHLIDAMVPLLPEGARISVLCNGEALPDFAHLHGGDICVHLVYPGFPNVPQRVAWCALAGAWATRRERADIYFSPKGFAPLALRWLGGAKRVAVTVHDLIPFWYARHAPNSVGRLERAFINSWLAHSVRSADRVVAISQATADALSSELGRKRHVAVVHNGVPRLPAATYRGPRDCIFALTSPLKHKNADGVLAAYAQYRRATAQPLPLIVCGLSGKGGDGVTAVADVAPRDLANLYARARAFLFLPFIEGFGFPVREAMLYGTPVVCSDIASLRESSGGAATFVAPGDAAACAQALMRVLGDVVPTVTPYAAPETAETWGACARATLTAIIEPWPPIDR
jgi:glycosyltransferase involved in cell wall biosynthesis